MPRFRKKPVEIEAVQLSRDNAGAIAHWIRRSGGEASIRGGRGGGSRGGTVYITTLEGTTRANVGDYVVRGLEGEFYPCKPDVFAATYDAVD